jgi:hypothetical protein
MEAQKHNLVMTKGKKRKGKTNQGGEKEQRKGTQTASKRARKGA